MARRHETSRVKVCLLLLAAAIFLSACADEPAPPALPELAVVKVVARDTAIVQDFVGQTKGSTDIPIRARVEGFLESRTFDEGRKVDKGQLLYTIDASPYLAQVVEAEGRRAEAETMLAKANADLARVRPLAEMKAVSQQDLDGAVAQRDAAQGALQAVNAKVDLANIQLGYAEIKSPTDGFIGISEAEVGEFVGREPNPVILNYVSLTDPIRVRFAINEREYLRLSRMLAERRKTGEKEEADGDNPIELLLADGTMHSYRGKVVSADAAINPNTGTFTLEADFPNPDHIIISGQFARVRIVIENRENALLIPQRAVSELQGLKRVFVVDQDGTVALKTIELGPQVGRLVLVNAGLKAGEQVAIEGLMGLRAGVTIKPRLVDFDEEPASKNSAED